MAEKMTGRVKWFNDQKGYGFITPDDGGEDIFVHQSSIVSIGFRTLREDEHVEFTIDSSPEGRIKAVDVTGPNGNPIQGSRSSAGGSGGRSGGRGGGRGGRGAGGECYNCGEMGHLARDCPSGGSSGSGGGRYGGGCFNCGEPGHFARECPNTGR